jgi:superfamily I DNA/RNA helicase
VTEHLIRACLKLIRAGKNARVRGRDIGDSLVYLIDKVSNFTNVPTQMFYAMLLAYQMQRVEQLKRIRRESEIQGLEDRVMSIQALAEECPDTNAIKKKIETIFIDDKSKHRGVDCMTAHKSKGLQARRVFVLRPDLMPHPRSEARDWMMQQERCLKYVAITRAEEELYWVLKAPGER